MSIAGVVVAGDRRRAEGRRRVCVLGSTADRGPGGIRVPLDGAARPAGSRPARGRLAHRGVGGRALRRRDPGRPGARAVLRHRPIRPCRRPGRGLPPLVVFCHGGPTAAAEPGFDPVVQFFTSRGLAVAVVDYRGSSGYGRAYRRALDGRWGEADVDDCVHSPEALADAGVVDGARMAIRGTSAGG